jgi:GNAT superfamily N-acetyltransferase
MNAEQSTLTVRQAVLADLDGLVELFDEYRQFYERSSDVEAARHFLLDRFNHGESIILLAEGGSRSLGFAQLFPAFSSVSMARTFILNDLYVRPSARRKGVARLLLDLAEEHAAKLGAVRITLSTAITNSEAQALYRSAGWTQDQEFYVFHRTITIP